MASPIDDESPLEVVSQELRILRCRFCHDTVQLTPGGSLTPEQRSWLLKHEVDEATTKHAKCWIGQLRVEFTKPADP